MDFFSRETMPEAGRPKGAEMVSVAGATELDTLEQQEMNRFAQETPVGAEAAEQLEMDEGARLGYSSDYYEHQMASALESGNQIAYDNAKRSWANAKVREST